MKYIPTGITIRGNPDVVKLLNYKNDDIRHFSPYILKSFIATWFATLLNEPNFDIHV